MKRLTDIPNRRLGSALPWLLFLFLFLTYAYFYQSGEHNENARFDQIRSLIEYHSLSIDRFSYNTADVVKHEGHIYPNKAPGATLIGVPAWLLADAILSPFDLSDSRREHFICYLTTLLSVGIFSALLAIVVYQIALRLVGTRILALALSLAFSLGTIAFPFSTLFFSHQLAASLLFLAFFCVINAAQRLDCDDRDTNTMMLLLLGGLLAGFAVTTEYPAGIGLIILSCYAVFRLKSKGLIFAFLSGAGLGGAPLLIYNYLVFGDLFFIPYSSYAADANSAFPGHGEGLVGVSLPKLRPFLEITFLPQRGLFLHNPWLLLMIPGAALLFRYQGYRAELVTCALIVICFFVFNAGYGDSIVYWGGAASVGPRHIIPMLPFAAILIAPLLTLGAARWFFYPTMLVSIAIMLMATAVEPRAGYEYQNPIYHLFWENYFHGRYALLDRGVFNSELITDNSIAFNLGKLFGLPGAMQLVPLLVFWLGGILLLLWVATAGGPRREQTGFRPITLGSTILILALISSPLGYAINQRQLTLTGQGLVGTYAQGVVWESPNEPVDGRVIPPRDIIISRTDPMVDFHWDFGETPIPGSFSVEWRGKLRVNETGDYVFATQSDDGSALYINDTLIVDNWGDHGSSQQRGSISLSPGLHKIVVRYYNRALGGSIVALWGKQHQQLRPIQREHLSIEEK